MFNMDIVSPCRYRTYSNRTDITSSAGAIWNVISGHYEVNKSDANSLDLTKVTDMRVSKMLVYSTQS